MIQPVSHDDGTYSYEILDRNGKILMRSKLRIADKNQCDAEVKRARDCAASAEKNPFVDVDL